MLIKKRIREWRKNKQKFLSLRKKDHVAKRKRLDGAGRKPLDQQMEEALAEWIYNRRKKGRRVSRKLIMEKLFSFAMRKQKKIIVKTV